MIINSDTQQDYFKKTARFINQHKIPIVIATYYGIGTGAGHYKQALIAEQVFREGGVLPQHIHLIILAGKTQFADTLYGHYLQTNPNLYNVITQVVNRPLFAPFFEQAMQKRHDTKPLEEELKKRRIDIHQPAFFITTHSQAARACADLLKRGQIPNPLFEYIPDPFPGNYLRVHSSPIKAPIHIVIPHDEHTKKEYTRLRGNGVTIWPLGTLSPKREVQKPSKEYPYVGIEFSGNPNKPYTRLVAQFITSIQSELKAKKLKLTIHAMHHSEAKKSLESVVNELELASYVELLLAKTVHGALKSQLSLISGTNGYTSPDIMLGKGERPLEYRSNQRFHTLFGAGHEAVNAKVGERAGRGRNLIGIPPEKWWDIISDDWKHNKYFLSQPSLAHLALPLYLKEKGLFI